jgi:murein DD-endopeptidase MepM/ murein hydrolase activator NlpD
MHIRTDRGAARPARRSLRRTLVLACLLAVGLVAPTPIGGVAAHADQEYWEGEFDRNEGELGDARSSLADAAGDIRSATADLQTIDMQLAGMYDELAARESELVTANADLDIARARTSVANNEVAAATLRLQGATADRVLAEGVFATRIVALWKYGTQGYADAIMHSDSISEALTQANYVGRVLDNDRNLIDGVTQAEAAITVERGLQDDARDTLLLEESGVNSAVTSIERLTSVQQDLVGRVEGEQVRRKRILDTLRTDERRYQLTVSALEAESDRIRDELRKSRYAAGRPGKGELVWPTSGAPGSGYGYRTHPISGKRKLHAGIDIAAPTGQKIVAATDGLVLSAGWRGGYGLAVVIDHGGGVATLYAHQSRLGVAEGDIVASGQTIGYIGTTGYSTGPHLHFEVRVDGTPVDPMDWY